MDLFLTICFVAGVLVVLYLIITPYLRKATGVEDLPDASREYWDDDKTLLN